MTTRRHLLAMLVSLLAAGAAVAHPPPRTTTRELLRLQGQRRADGEAPAGRLEIAALGETHPFAATAVEVYGMTDAEPGKPTTQYVLQGPRPLLGRFTGARPDQTVTILAERRPGSPELFVLALDLCPPR
jgi:hypothetical protein